MLFISSNSFGTHYSVLTKFDRGIWPQRYCVPASFVTLNRWEEERDLYVITLHIPLRERLQSIHVLCQTIVFPGNTTYATSREKNFRRSI